jgi:hypothetical protein
MFQRPSNTRFSTQARRLALLVTYASTTGSNIHHPPIYFSTRPLRLAQTSTCDRRLWSRPLRSMSSANGRYAPLRPSNVKAAQNQMRPRSRLRRGTTRSTPTGRTGDSAHRAPQRRTGFSIKDFYCLKCALLRVLNSRSAACFDILSSSLGMGIPMLQGNAAPSRFSIISTKFVLSSAASARTRFNIGLCAAKGSGSGRWRSISRISRIQARSLSQQLPAVTDDKDRAKIWRRPPAGPGLAALRPRKGNHCGFSGRHHCHNFGKITAFATRPPGPNELPGQSFGEVE